MSHTPGPWEAHRPNEWDDPSEYWEIDDQYGHTATVYGDTAEAEANARLIAAAPDLLRLIGRLREVFEQLSDGDWRHMDATYVDQLIESDGLRACDEVIAKAKGRIA